MNNVAEAVYGLDVSCLTKWISIFIFPEWAPFAMKIFVYYRRIQNQKLKGS
jgi:hypothetical protein